MRITPQCVRGSHHNVSWDHSTGKAEVRWGIKVKKARTVGRKMRKEHIILDKSLSILEAVKNLTFFR